MNTPERIQASQIEPAVAARVFSDEELRDMVTSAGDKATAALRAGDLQRARRLCHDAQGEHLVLAANYTIWNSQTLAHVYKTRGLDALVECIDESLPGFFRPVAESFRNGVTIDAVIALVRLWRMISTQFGPVTETEDRFTFTMKVLPDVWSVNQRGDHAPALAAPAGALILAPDLSHERDFHVLAQALLQAEALMIKWLGYPAFTVDIQQGGEPFRVTVYKDPSDVPADRFARVGATRDARRIRGAVSVKGGRLCSARELAAMSHTCFARAIDAIDAGDIPGAIGLCQQTKNEWFPSHHAVRDWVTGMLSFIYRRYGIDAAHQAVIKGYEEQTAKTMFDAVAQQNLREQVEGLAAGFRQHAMQFRIVEDADKFVFVTEPCGSGGRLLDEGAYASPKNFALIKEKHEATFYLENFPVYCMHCPSTNIQVFNRGGPYYLMVDGELMTVPDGNCDFYIFKNPDAIPERFYTRAGRTKPGCGSCSTA
jgi:hypothetical protein